jgi:hypothetical protein
MAILSWVARAGLSICAIGAIAAGAWMARAPIGTAALRPPPRPAPPGADPAPSVELVDSLAELAASRAPFRAMRAPADVPFDPWVEPAVFDPAVPPPPKPMLLLTGLVWAREPAALVEGIPGTDGPRVLRPGERVGELRVQRIESDRVVIVGYDTTWTLTVRQAWR